MAAHEHAELARRSDARDEYLPHVEAVFAEAHAIPHSVVDLDLASTSRVLGESVTLHLTVLDHDDLRGALSAHEPALALLSAALLESATGDEREALKAKAELNEARDAMRRK